MSEIKDGGPAFPITDPCQAGGMTLRDWFAGKAMAACVSACQGDTRLPGETQSELIARRSYELADAMLKAREA